MSWTLVLGSVFAVHVLAILSPGPNILVVTHTAMSGTRRAGVAAALGIAVGAAIWSGTALIGLSVAFAHFAWLYAALKMAGGIYLLLLAFKLLRRSRLRSCTAATPPVVTTNGQAFRLGVLTNVTNPKALVFYGSIFAALVPPAAPLALKLASIGVIVINSAAWHIAFAWLFSTPSVQRIHERAGAWIDRGAGALLGLLGIWLLLSGA
ncbi:MAG: LysE family transporter [Burkholderiales bacterium]